MANHLDDVFPVLMNALSDSNEEVLILDLHVIGEVCSDLSTESKQKLFDSSVKHLVEQFKKNRTLMDTKGQYIVR